MVDRPYWLERVEEAWRRRSVVWLRGVRRAGKTVLARSLPGAEYFDCELPRVRRLFEDPEAFFAERKEARVVLDEVHRLPDPAQVLKIAADHFPGARVLATGSSTLEATARFRDTLTGRKAEVWLTPMSEADRAAFGGDLRGRLVKGGLPPFYLAQARAEGEYQDWVDAFWAKDIQELFRLERRASFGRFLELLFAQSGAHFEATRFATPCEVSRQTVTNYLAVLEATMAAHVVRPFATRKEAEIVAAPKVYGFDTGFAAHFRGWDSPREDELGALWEHYVLNELQARLQRTPRYWRDKQGHEVDFVWAAPGKPPAAIECKWKAAAFEAGSLAVFRRRYPKGPNLVAASDVERPYRRRYGELEVSFCGLKELPELAASA